MAAALTTSFRTFNRSIRLYLLATLLLGLSVDGVYAVLFNLYLLRLGYNPEFIGLANAAGLAFIVAGSQWGQADGQVIFLFILSMAAAEVAVGLALVLQLYQRYQTLDSNILVE